MIFLCRWNHSLGRSNDTRGMSLSNGTSGARMLVLVASKAVFDVDGLTASARSKRLPISSMISYKFLLARAM